jgi:hypothetical protein
LIAAPYRLVDFIGQLELLILCEHVTTSSVLARTFAEGCDVVEEVIVDDVNAELHGAYKDCGGSS